MKTVKTLSIGLFLIGFIIGVSITTASADSVELRLYDGQSIKFSLEGITPNQAEAMSQELKRRFDNFEEICIEECSGIEEIHLNGKKLLPHKSNES